MDIDIDEPCGLELAVSMTCVAKEGWHKGCDSDYPECTAAALAYSDCLVALEQGGGGSGP
jgi:hypothetical protein